jgi:SAM-dependent methyltransferase
MDRSKEVLRAASRTVEGARALYRGLRRALPFRRSVPVLAPEDAYRLWSETYDAQPGNVVLALEQEIFSELLAGAPVAGSTVVDIGCGTGRHWAQLLAGRPRALHGVDSSPDMLERLRKRYPDAPLHGRFGDRTLGEFAGGSVDLVVSTLMLGHVRDAEAELREWDRLLAARGEVILTDFHPEALRRGAKRTFPHQGATFEVESHMHGVEALRSLFRALRLEIVAFRERAYDGAPVVLGFRLRRMGR